MNYPRANGDSVSPGRGLLIPHGYLHPGKCEHSEVQSSSMIAGASALPSPGFYPEISGFFEADGIFLGFCWDF